MRGCGLLRPELARERVVAAFLVGEEVGDGVAEAEAAEASPRREEVRARVGVRRVALARCAGGTGSAIFLRASSRLKFGGGGGLALSSHALEGDEFARARRGVVTPITLLARGGGRENSSSWSRLSSPASSSSTFTGCAADSDCGCCSAACLPVSIGQFRTPTRQ